MDEIQKRLLMCFGIVFPTVPAAELASCSQVTNSAWDSIAAITLVNVIEDEFGFQIDFDDLPALNSFSLVLSYLRKHIQG